MLRKNAFRVASFAALVAMISIASSCAAKPTESTDSVSSNQSAPNETPSDANTNRDEDRVFDSTDDAVIQVAETTLKSQNARAEWAGKTLRVMLDGSVDDATAHLPCLGMEALVADDEDVTLVFSDGDLICADR